MKKQNKVIFYGTPDFARDCLKHLINEGVNISAVVTAPDKYSGRGRRINYIVIKILVFGVGLLIQTFII